MHLYAALSAFLCISFSSGATTPFTDTDTTTTITSTTTTTQTTTTTPTYTTPRTNTTTPTTTTTINNTTTTNTPTTSTQETTSTTAQPNVIIQETKNYCTREGLASDVLELGCWGYIRCVNNTKVTYWCSGSTVLERDSMTCIRPGTGKTDCGKEFSCVGLEDGKYADTGSGCQSYSQCVNGYTYPHIYCPRSLYFNQELQICDHQYNIEPPCGTKVVLQ